MRLTMNAAPDGALLLFNISQRLRAGLTNSAPSTPLRASPVGAGSLMVRRAAPGLNAKFYQQPTRAVSRHGARALSVRIKLPY